MADDTAQAQQSAADTSTDIGTGTVTTDARDAGTGTTGNAATASAWDTLGSYDEVKKRLEFARTWEKRAKDNSDAAKKLAAMEESQKTESQRLTDRLAEAEKELAQHRIVAIRSKAARDAGLDGDMAQFLTETEPETALAQAKALAKKIQPVKPDLRQGARTTARPADDMNAWLRRQTGYDRT